MTSRGSNAPLSGTNATSNGCYYASVDSDADSSDSDSLACEHAEHAHFYCTHHEDSDDEPANEHDWAVYSASSNDDACKETDSSTDDSSDGDDKNTRV
eukprot:IDg18510t1